MSIGAVEVAGVLLPDLPPGTAVAFDTETSGLFVDGDPGTDSGDPGSPPARVSAASVAWRDPDTGKLQVHAWGFDQGPHPSKPGRVRRPKEGGGIEPFDCDKMLMNLAKAGYNRGTTPRISPKTGKTLKSVDPIPYTWEECYEAIGLQHWVNLMRWLRARDLIIAHNAKFDMHIAAAGPRDWLVRHEWANNPVFSQMFSKTAFDLIEHDLTFGDGPRISRDLGWDLDRLDDRKTLRPARETWCTMVVQSILEPLQSTALKPTHKRIFRRDSDAEQKKLAAVRQKQGVGLTNRYDLTPWFLIRDYAAQDAVEALELYEHQIRCIAEGDCPPHVWEQIEKEAELLRVLYRMEDRGVEYDVEESRAGAQDLVDWMNGIEIDLPYNPHKLDEVRNFYFGPEEKGGLNLLPNKVTEKTNTPSMDEAQVRIWVESGSPPPFAQEYDEWSHCKSAVGKWYRGWAERTGPDGRLRTDFKQCVVDEDRKGARSGGAISGRLAVGRAQLHAIPHSAQLPYPVRNRPVRKLVGAREGHTLYEMDLPQGEVRIATVIVNCQAMWDVVDSGADLHGANATRIFKVGEDDPRYKDLRGVAKRIVFGTLYGAGVTTLKKQILEFTGLEYSEAETREARDAFNTAFPEFPRVANRIQRKADRNMGGPGYVELIDGRRRWFGPEEFTHKAFNAVIQGGLAQTGKTWMIEVERQLPGIQVLAIHDSIVVEVEDNARGYAMAEQVAAIGRAVYEKDYGIRGRKMAFPIVPERWDKKIGDVTATSTRGRVESVSA